MNIDFVHNYHEHIFKLYIKRIFLGKYLCMHHSEFEHDRLTNVQNPIKIPESVPEPNACRKQFIGRHFNYTHPKCEKKQELKMKRKKDCLLYTSPSPRDRG